jgi:hypothetical protein
LINNILISNSCEGFMGYIDEESNHTGRHRNQEIWNELANINSVWQTKEVAGKGSM